MQVKEYLVEYLAVRKNAGPLTRKKVSVEAAGKREAWKKVKERLKKEYDVPFFGCNMSFRKLGITAK